MTDQTDRELLELAAKACGTQSESRMFDGGYWIPEGSDLQRPWNPLTDDGDALRLAVNLGMQIDAREPETHVYAHGAGGRVDEYHTKGDALAATRRAIVRAAAAIAQNGAKS